MVAFTCTSCQKKLTVKDELAGQKGQCPSCGQPITVPAGAPWPADRTVPPQPAAPGAERTVPPHPVPSGTDSVSDAEGNTGAVPGPAQPAPQAESAEGPDPELWAFLGPARQADEIGRLGPYRILQVLGAGGMGVVFRAEDLALRRLVALKAMLPSLASSRQAKERFFREARAAAALKHPHIVTIFQVGEDRGAPYLAMEYLEGEALDRRLKRQQPLPLAEVLRIGREVAAGLACAHAKGLIHRDIKPANLWLESPEGLVKILDFGLARALDDQTHLTQSGAIVGTPAYMAPEQACGKAVDPRSDLFSLGCVLYRLVTGRMPFQGDNTLSLLSALALETPPEPRQLNPDIPVGLNALIVQLLSKKPEERPGTAQAVVEALRQLERDSQVTMPLLDVKLPQSAPARRTAQTVRPGAVKSRRPSWLGIGAALVAVLAVVLWWGTSPGPVRNDLPGKTVTNPAPPPPVEAEGLVRLECHDAGVEIVFDKTGPTLKGGSKEPLRLRVGEHGLLVQRGAVAFETDKLVVKKGETVVLKVEVLPGKIQVAAAGRMLGVRDLPGVPVVVKPPPLGPPPPAAYTNKLGMAFALVPRGKSWLGGSKGTVGTKEVEIRQDFYLGVYAVTQEEWEKIMKSNPSQFKAVAGVTKEEQKRFPVENISWENAQAFVKQMNEHYKEAGWEYRLPTEEEWEYACRGGPMADKADSGYDFYLDKPTNVLPPDKANFGETGLKRPCPVGSYAPNRLGLYDMHGNVRQWCADEVPGSAGASRRVNRGGGWSSTSVICGAATRIVFTPSHRDSHLGMRLARVPVGNQVK